MSFLLQSLAFRSGTTYHHIHFFTLLAQDLSPPFRELL